MDENESDSKFLRLQFSRKPGSRPGQRGRRWWLRDIVVRQPNGDLWYLLWRKYTSSLSKYNLNEIAHYITYVLEATWVERNKDARRV